jgi:hypothetical protein
METFIEKSNRLAIHAKKTLELINKKCAEVTKKELERIKKKKELSGKN